MFDTVDKQVGLLLCLLSCGFAAWRGGRPERTVAAATVAGWLITPLAFRHDFLLPQYGMLGIDIVYLVVLLAVALLSDRYWPMWATAFHLLAVTMHLAYMADPNIWPWAFFIGNNVCQYSVLAALAVGTWIEADAGRSRCEASAHGSARPAP